MKAYLFDFDGTLVDSMPTYASVMLRILDEQKVPYDADIIKIITPLGYKGTAEYYKKLGMEISVEECVGFMNRYCLHEYTYNIQAKANVENVLKKLKGQGASLNVLTASPHTMLDPCLNRLGLFDLFDNVWSCDDFGTTKSNPEIYKMAAERIGVPVEEVLFLDDNFNADRAAIQAGMKVCGVYDPSSAEYEEIMKKQADFYIYDFCELLEI